MKYKLITSFFVVLTALVAVPTITLADPGPQTYSFYSKSPVNDNIDLSNLYVVLTDLDTGDETGGIEFVFHNETNSDISVSNIYFADNKSYYLTYDQPEIDQVADSSIKNVTEINGNELHFLDNFRIGPGEELNVSFNYALKENGKNYYKFGNVIGALTTESLTGVLTEGAMDIGMNVQPLGGGSSFYVSLNGVTPVPEPATMLLFGTGLAGIAGIVRKRKKLQK